MSNILDAPQVIVDTENSTSTPLGAGATFTGTAVDVSGYQAVILQGYSDKSSATEGAKIQSSTNGTNWDHEHAYTLTGGGSLHIEETLTAKYYRIVYVNGSQAQTTFRLQAKLLTTAATAHVHDLAHPLTDNHPAPVVRAVLTGRSTAGGTNYVNVKVNPSGTLAIATSSVGATGAATPSDATLIAGTDGTNLRGVSVDTSGRPNVRDDYALGEVLADQAGADAVLTFTFSAQVAMFWVAVVGDAGVCKLDHYGGTPSASSGIPVGPDAPSAILPVPEPATSVKVYAPTGTTVTVWGHFR